MPQKHPERGSTNIVFRQQHRLSKMNALETRQTPRGYVLLAASLTVRGASRGRRVLIRNLSSLGMQVKGDFDAQEGEGVEIDFGRAGKANGIVVWCDGHVSGLKLEQAIEPSEFRKAAI
jgi:prepilin-type processing-associated H-X9-DG protein